MKVKFETAKLAKEKGFKKIVKSYYSEDGKSMRVSLTSKNFNTRETISAPSQSLLQKWLREAHDIHIVVQNVNVPNLGKWMYEINKIPSGVLVLWDKDISPNFNTYEKALEAALQQSLKILLWKIN